MTTRAQPISAASGQRYGQRKAQEDAQRAAPMAGSQRPAPPSPGGGPQGQPIQRPNIFGPTDRPSEPLTAGAALGAGPSDLGLLPPDPILHLRELYRLAPSDDLRRLIERASERR